MRYFKHHNSKNKTDNIIQIALFVIIGLWLGFTLLTTFYPNSIGYLETQGKKAEALSLIGYGNKFLLERNFKLAAGQYIEAIRIDQENNAALVNLSLCYTHMGLYNKAIIGLQEVLKNKPNQKYEIYYNLGEIFFKKEIYDKSGMYFQKSAESDPFPLDAYIYLARTYKKQKKWKEALNTFQICLQYIPDMESTYLGTLKELQYKFTGNQEDSLKVSDILNEYQGKDELLNRFDPSVFDYKKDNKKNLSNIYIDIGFSYSQLGDNTKAIENINYALKLNPSSISAKKFLKLLKSQGY
ncbi:MAG: tetratricopeptide repeat protein [Bacteroidales bacterium]|nr:tetratricopeptide repeat protein [Bacteroidales bacterium]